jgi:hypothetical protein
MGAQQVMACFIPGTARVRNMAWGNGFWKVGYWRAWIHAFTGAKGQRL